MENLYNKILIARHHQNEELENRYVKRWEEQFPQVSIPSRD